MRSTPLPSRSRPRRFFFIFGIAVLALSFTTLALILPAAAAPIASPSFQGATPDPEQAPPPTEEAAGGEDSAQPPGDASQVPAVDFTLTVGLDPNVCSASDSVIVLPGSQVYYCYLVTNSGTITLTRHDLVDDQIGMILSNFAFPLAPGATVFLTQSVVVTQAVQHLATWTAYNPGPVDVAQDADTADVAMPMSGRGKLIAGTGGFGGLAANPVFETSVTVPNSFQALFDGFSVGGATFDPAVQQVLFTSSNASGSGALEFADLWTWPLTGGLPTPVGAINSTTSTLRIDGLAIVDNVLYGVHQFDTAGDPAGLYQIDRPSLQATLIVTTTSGAISGIDADPITGKIYGVNDATGQLIVFDLAGSTTDVVAYPAGETDIDGLAVDNHHRAYLIPDDPVSGQIYVFNLSTMAYEPSLTSPWTGTDTFSGGAFVYDWHVHLPFVGKAP